ncbi:hypothetical protein GCM10010109_30350 [Actinoplanes campanulatus]|nr:hypothetical protein GCM10010109_30350 [Actinoplanes campanulatus]GID38601.1 hypothetical protein Aca09nite_51070 [Actinoplanes campanulatus]
MEPPPLAVALSVAPPAPALSVATLSVAPPAPISFVAFAACVGRLRGFPRPRRPEKPHGGGTIDSGMPVPQ